MTFPIYYTETVADTQTESEEDAYATTEEEFETQGRRKKVKKGPKQTKIPNLGFAP